MWRRLYLHAAFLILTNFTFSASCQGNGSLTFVIDDTTSMGDDIKQVRKIVDRIQDIVLKKKNSLIDSMVLVTFNDPGVYTRIVTKNPKSFKKALSAVKPHNEQKASETDCWEPSIKGLLQALDRSNKDSYIFVFTDASAKDYKDSQSVIEMCQKKQTQIVFVLTGKLCSKFSYPPEATNVYYDMANACSGLAFHVKKTEVDKVFGPIGEMITGNKTVITTATVPANVSKDIQFTIDDSTDYVIISASGLEVTLKISNNLATEQVIMSTDNAKVIKLSNAKPGSYFATVKGKSRTSVMVVGRTDFFFNHGFSESKPNSMADTSPQPTADALVYLAIHVTDDNHAAKIVWANILNEDGEPILTKLPLTEISKDVYITGPFHAPSQRFKVALDGIVIATGKPINRTAKIPVTPVRPKIAPKIERQKVTDIKVSSGETAVLECKIVSGFPAPKISWLFGGKLGSEFTPIAGSENVLRINNVEGKHGGKYKCVAENELAKDENVLTLFVTDLPKIVSKLVTIHESTEGDAVLRIPCLAAGLPKPTITWTLHGQVIRPSAKYSIEDGALIIRNPLVNDPNSYTCEAKNEVGTDKATFRTYIRQAPRVSGLAVKKVNVGSSVSIECMVVKGEPKPTIEWQFMSSSSSKFLPITGGYQSLIISRVEEKDAGRYKCIAENTVGSNEHTTTLEVTEQSKVAQNNDSNIFETTEGDAVLRIPCVAAGLLKSNGTNDTPLNITWKLNGQVITPSAKYSIEDGALVIRALNVNDSNTYTCEASNDVGTYRTTFKAYIRQTPQVSGVSVKKVKIGLPASIVCTIAVGGPKNNVTWEFKGKSAPQFVPIAGLGNTLRILIAEHKHEGDYKCVAQNNLGSQEQVTTLVVENLPENTTKPTTVEGVVGDLALKVHCDTVGVLQPDITWKKHETTITASVKYAIEDGALLIMNPTESDSALYTCEAKNNANSFSATFQVTVEKLPRSAGTVHYENVKSGETKTIKCDGYTSESQSIKWFKTQVMQQYPALPDQQSLETSTISNKNRSETSTRFIHNSKAFIKITEGFHHHDVNYTCRVSDIHGNTETHTYVVKVGSAPEFLYSADSFNNWEGYIADITSICEHDKNLKPSPIIKWTYNGKELTDLNSAGLGHYTCNLSNAHGSVQRKFDVKSSGTVMVPNIMEVKTFT